MRTYHCVECGDEFDANRQRDFCGLDCVDDYENRTDTKVQRDPFLALQEMSTVAYNELLCRAEDAGSIYDDDEYIFLVVRNGKEMRLPLNEMTNDELQRIADSYDDSSDTGCDTPSRWDLLEIQR